MNADYDAFLIPSNIFHCKLIHFLKYKKGDNKTDFILSLQYHRMCSHEW